MIKLEYVTSNDKNFWYSLDKHLPENLGRILERIR